MIQRTEKHKIDQIEVLRKKLRADQSLIELTDLKSGQTKMTSIGTEAKKSASTAKFGSFLSLLIKMVNAQSVLETGTSLGLTTGYLATHPAQVTSIEGSYTMARMAQKHFDALGYQNIEQVCGDLYEVLEGAIVKNSPDFYFLDADHRSTAVAFCIDLILRHTPTTKCIVIHDIYWSSDMKRIWHSLVQDPRFTLSIDLFQAGLLFPTLHMEKQHFTLHF